MALHPKSAVEDSEELQNLYNQVWAAFTEDSKASNDGDLDNIYGGYANDNPQPPPVPHKRT